MKTDPGRIPPHNIDAEKSILASMIIEPDSIVDISARYEHFYRPAHQMIFKSIMDLHSKKDQVDIITVFEKLKESGKIEECGGISYLSELTEYPISVNPEYHCGILKKHYDLRRLIEISYGIINQSFSQTVSPVDIIGKVQREIFDIGKGTSGIATMPDIMNDVMDCIGVMMKRPGELSGLSTGFRDLDFHTSGFQKSDLILLGARPSMGKTALSLNICKHIASYGHPVLVFSLEMSNRQFGQRFLSEESSLNLRKVVSGGISEIEFNQAYSSASILSDYPIYIEDNAGMTIEDMISIARKMKHKHGIKFVCVDYIQLIKGWNKEGQGPKADISRALKLMAKSLDVPVLALSQLNRLCETRADKRPISADLRETGSLEQDADIIMFLYRDEVYNTDASNLNKGMAELLIRKNRQGTTGTVKLAWLGKYQRFANLSVENERGF